MKYLRSLAFPILLTIISVPALAQELLAPLPAISVRELTKGKVQISWNNPYETCIQLAIQRSTDSINNFRTIFSSLSPELPSNGFVDNKPIRGIRSYYRIFYVLQGGAYYFSRIVPVDIKWTEPPGTSSSSRIINEANQQLTRILVNGSEVFKLSKSEYERFRDSLNRQTMDNLKRVNASTVEWMPAPVKRGSDQKMVHIYKKENLFTSLTETAYKLFRDSVAAYTKDTLYMIDPYRIQLRPFVTVPEYISVYRHDTLVRKLEVHLYKKFRDSIALGTRDTLFSVDAYRLDIHPFITKFAWRPSQYVFTNARGYVSILLPLFKQHRYRIIFYDDTDGSELFQIKSLKEQELVLDKTNFIHAGWFSFELYEDDKLKEKNKFFLTKE